MTETPLDHALQRIHDLESVKRAQAATIKDLQDTLRLVCTQRESDALKVMRKLLVHLELEAH